MLQNTQTEFAENVWEGLLGTTQLSAPYKIYQNNIRITLLKTLMDCYPLLIKLLGKEFFVQCMQDYIGKYPSRSSNLHDYGQYVADFLAEYELTAHFTYLPEVAQFEWLCHQLQFAAQHAPLDLHKLEKISPERMENMRFMLNPACALQRFYYPILRIIELCEKETEDEIHLAPEEVNLLIIRRDFNLKLVPLTPPEFAFLQALHESHSLAEALEAASAFDNEHSFHLEEKLPQWVHDQTLVDCY